METGVTGPLGTLAVQPVEMALRPELVFATILHLPMVAQPAPAMPLNRNLAISKPAHLQVYFDN